eukprot:SAG31_NODE_3798_length_3873_cov_6.539746_3_plen_147_part_00
MASRPVTCSKRYGTQLWAHALSCLAASYHARSLATPQFDLDEGKTISKDEFIAVLDAKYAKDAVRTAKWVKYLSNPPKGKPKKERLAEAAETEAWIANIALGEQETSKVEKIKIGELKHLKDNAEDMATVDAVFAACDADSNGETN